MNDQKEIFVSIGIPIYNAEKYLASAIISVLNQTYKNFELILLDDGSTDNSLNIAKSFSDPRIKIVSDGINKGLISRLNQLIDFSNGKYFVRMDNDDIMFPDRIEKQLNVFKNNSTIDLVHSDAISITNENLILGYKKSRPQINKLDILNGMTPIHPTVMARMQFYKDNRYENDFVQMEDVELWYRTIDNYVFFNLNEPCLFYREESTLISKKHIIMIRGKLNFAKKYNLSTINSLKIVVSARIKGLVYLVFEKFNLQGFLLSKRYIEISDTEKLKYNTILTEIVQ